jgi:hypothetical protein
MEGEVGTWNDVLAAVDPGAEILMRFDEQDLPREDEIHDIFEKLLFDYVIFKKPDSTLWLLGQKKSRPPHAGHFLDIDARAEGTILYKKKHRYLIYVLAHDAETFNAASERYETCDWARVIWIPSCWWLESVMYFHILPSRLWEWQHATYVGTIASSAHKKIKNLSLESVLQEGENHQADVVSFLFRGDPLVKTAEYWHPGFTEAWKRLLFSCMKASLDEACDASIPSFYCNYWSAKPDVMQKYIDFFVRAKNFLETDDTLKPYVWQDSTYTQREGDRYSVEKCMTLFGCDYYPMLPFIGERLPCFFVHHHRLKLLCSW